MKITKLHDWNLTAREAIEIQKQLAYEVIFEDKFASPIKTVAGIDLGYDQKNDTSRAVVVVLSFPNKFRNGDRNRFAMCAEISSAGDDAARR